MLHIISCMFWREKCTYSTFLCQLFSVHFHYLFSNIFYAITVRTNYRDSSWLWYLYRHSHLHNATSKCGNRIGGEKRWRKGTVKECSPRNVKRRGAGCRLRSDNLYEQINENPPSLEHTRREKKRRTWAERKKGTIRLRCFNSLSGDNDLRQVDPRFLHFFRSRQTPPAVIW